MRRAIGGAALALALIGAGCARDEPTQPSVHTLDGHVRLVAPHTLADGHFVGHHVIDAADGVPVELRFGNRVVAQVTTHAGHYAFTGVEPGSYKVRATLWGPIAGETVALTVANTDLTSLDTLRLASVGDLFPAPNPWTSGDTWLAFDIATSDTAQVMIRDLTGRPVRKIADALLTAGNWVMHWNGADSTGTTVPHGLYWATFECRADRRAQLLMR